MHKPNINLIFVFAILIFIFGLSLIFPANAHAQYYNNYPYNYTYTTNGVIPFPYYPTYYPRTQYTGITYNPAPMAYNQTPIVYNQTPAGATPTPIAGCNDRTTGFSTITGQSCVGNLVSNSNTNNSNSTVSKVSKNTNTDKKVATNAGVGSDVNETYGSLTANALLGSNGFMPSGLMQWIFLAILILALIFLWRYIHFSEEKYLATPLKHS